MSLKSCFKLIAITVFSLFVETIASPTLPWAYTNTGTSHTIIIPMTANPRVDGVPLTAGDYIGVFYDSSGTLKCGGYEMWTVTTNISVAAFGDDPLTSGKDGFSNSEVFRLKVWDHTNDKVVDVFADYQPIGYGGYVTDTSRYTANGISQIKDGPLPIQLSSFTASIVGGNSVRLDWTTISEVNNYGFYVERRSEGVVSFTEVPNSFIPGNGTTLEPHTYGFTDNTAQSGTWYYRLRQVDLDGMLNYTQEVKVDILLGVKEEIPRIFALHQNYPNPFNPSTEIKFSVETMTRTTLKIYNILGSEVTTLFDEVAEPGRYYMVTYGNMNLPSGMYFYRLQSGEKVDIKKMILLK